MFGLPNGYLGICLTSIVLELCEIFGLPNEYLYNVKITIASQHNEEFDLPNNQCTKKTKEIIMQEKRNLSAQEREIIEEIRSKKELCALYLAYYKFDFIRLTDVQKDEICDMLYEELEARGVLNVTNLVKFLRERNIPFALRFAPQADLPNDINVKLYTEEFLPLYKKLQENGWFFDMHIPQN